MDCCNPANSVLSAKTECPSCGGKGMNVQLITLKSLLKSSAIEAIWPEDSYVFCSNPVCSIVYFSGNHSQTFVENDLKVPVFQKNQGADVPVCYCFDWTRNRLLRAVSTDEKPADQIKAHVQAGQCGCEENNPQGSCCLGNVNSFLQGLKKG